MADEPFGREFVTSLGRSIASVELIEVLKRKFQAQSFWEFFNRLTALSYLLFLIGASAVLLLLGGGDLPSPISDLFVLIAMVAAALFVWFVLVLVRATNLGAEPIAGHSKPNVGMGLIKTLFGLGVTWFLVDGIILGAPTAFGGLMTVVFGVLLTSMWLIGLSWLFGGLSGLIRHFT